MSAPGSALCKQPGFHFPGAAQGRGGDTAAPRAVTSLAQLFPDMLRTWSWGKPILPILLVFRSKSATEGASDVDNGCVIKLGVPQHPACAQHPHVMETQAAMQPQLDLGDPVGCSPF